MIYLIAFQQDIVFAFVQSRLSANADLSGRVRLVALEEVVAAETDLNDYFCREIKTTATTIYLQPSDKIYLRPYAFAEAACLKIFAADDLSRIRKTYQELLLARQVVLGNTALRADSNNSKFFHGELFSDLIPTEKTEMLNGSIEARVGRDIVVKSPSAVRVEVTDIRSFAHTLSDHQAPLILAQRRFNGIPIRVTVVGYKSIVAAEILASDAVDYRYSESQEIAIRKIDLPKQIFEAAILISKRYGLPLCGIDLLMRGDSFCFLEVNPEPGWAFLPARESEEILELILNYLDSGHGTLEPDLGWKSLPNFSARLCTSTDRYPSFPSALRPNDFIARPYETHPFWGPA